MDLVILSIASTSHVEPRVLPVFPLPFIPAQYRWKVDHIAIRLL